MGCIDYLLIGLGAGAVLGVLCFGRRRPAPGYQPRGSGLGPHNPPPNMGTSGRPPKPVIINEGTVKKSLNEPPTTPRPPAPRAQVPPPRSAR